MEHFGFALQAVLPFMLLLLLGSWLRGKGILSSSFSTEGDKLCLKVLFPALVYRSIINGNGDFSSYTRSIAFSYLVIISSLIIGTLIVPRIVSDRRKIAVIIQCAYRGNYTMYGIAFSQLLGGDEAAAVASIIAAATLPLLNTTSAAMYAHYSGEENHSIMHTLLMVLKNPIIIAIMLALTVSTANIPVPGVLNAFVGNLAAIATPLAFILLGTRLTKEYMQADLKTTVIVLIIKLLVMPAIFIPVAVVGFGIAGPALVPLFLFVAAPCAIMAYQFAVQYGADEQLAGNLVTMSTLVSSVSICIIISVLKILELL